MGGSKEGSFLSILMKAGNDKEFQTATNHPGPMAFYLLRHVGLILFIYLSLPFELS